MKIGLIGCGTVGEEIANLFRLNAEDIFDPAVGYNGNVSSRDVVFICVPTPLVGETLDTSIVESALGFVSEDSIAVIKSTVLPGFCRSLTRKVVYNPEFLGMTPGHVMNGKYDSLLFGGEAVDVNKVIAAYFQVLPPHTRIRMMSLEEAEVVKLSVNRAMFWKVLQAQELYDACTKNGVEYYRVRDAIYGDDPRLSLHHTAIYEQRGCFSPCLPKDVWAWQHWAGTELTKQLLLQNEKYEH